MKPVLCLMVLSPLLAHAQPGYSADKELALGKQLASELERNVAVVNDPAITGYVDRMARNLAETAILRTPLTTKVVSGSNAYATTLPGGFLYVDSTLILDAASEAEVASVIAHQIGHLELSPAPIYQTAGTIPLTFMGGQCVRCGLHSACMGMAIPMGFLATSRDREAKADQLALGNLQNAGYDPGALVDFYGRMTKPQPGAVSRVFAQGQTVSESTRAEVESMRNARVFVVTRSEFEEIQRRVAPPLANAVRRTSVPSLRTNGQ
jgi:predicted Zn-dependent protease